MRRDIFTEEHEAFVVTWCGPSRRHGEIEGSPRLQRNGCG
jgi:hypothetical protein